jgi:hypothetical protein
VSKDLPPAAMVAAMIKSGRQTRLDWDEVVRLLAGQGVVGPDGLPLKPEAARKAYYRMRKVKGLVKPRTKRRPSQKREAEQVGVFAPPAPTLVRAAPLPTSNDSVARVIAGWQSGKAKMPKPMGGE